MASAADDIAKNIARNVVPFNAGQDLAGPYGAAEGTIMKLLQSLGLMGAPQQAAPPLNMPLPRKDPRTGQIIFPEGYTGPR
jgi:hypothetical protein